MKIKNKKLVWNVLLHDFNSDKIITYNVFGDEFKENLYKEYRKKKINNCFQIVPLVILLSILFPPLN